jgi:hypothetical protein
MNRAPPLLQPRAERLHGLDREGRGQMGMAHSNSIFLFLFRINSNLVQTSEICRELNKLDKILIFNSIV